MTPAQDKEITLESFADNASIPTSATTTKSSKPTEADMIFYYQRLFPFRQIFQWLSHSPKPTQDFTMREFAYEYRSGAYSRYNSFSTLDDFKKSVILANPTRFEIGAKYNINPNQRKHVPKSALKPVSKELVFDIDLTDYDGIRTCCAGTDICEKCWRFIQVGSKILDGALRQDFGFENLVWVFSGRRGAHCWVSDARARELDEGARRGIVEYLDVLGGKSGGGNKGGMNIKRPFHPHVERSFEILKGEFTSIVLDEQNPWVTEFGSDDNWNKVDELLGFIPNKQLQLELKNKWKSQTRYSDSRSKWEDLNSVARSVLKNNSQVNQLNEAKKDIIIYYMYPRLDVEVSRQLIHLLKSPFCIHPSTGNICVPFDPTKNISGNNQDDEYGFNPMHAPNLKQIQNELENYMDEDNNEDDDGEHKIQDFEKTSLKPYINYFSKFVNELIKTELKGIGSKRERDDDNLEF
ncbi:PRI1 [[Candida] subhashii]|uniref:DNA primase n=1 Tax=[Candida] subhashii TaxID=561895 RepID=A0A8J5QGQ4_9ASCO|nr:PRI1 [[Candida] subhashii]KAG7660881.1 PRI1 [[Candida] subhashii]